MPHTLLLADDSVTIQRVIELTFADEDVQVVAVSDGDQAIAAVDERPPDIVLADVGMPGRDGYQVAKHIKSTPRLAHIPVVLLTGAFEPIDQARAAEAGCDGVLAKPFEPQLVIGRVRELLAKRPQVPPSIDSALSPPLVDLPLGAARPKAPEAGSAEAYFDRLDQAFANLATGGPAPTHAAAPPVNDAIDWFSQSPPPPDASLSHQAPAASPGYEIRPPATAGQTRAPAPAPYVPPPAPPVQPPPPPPLPPLADAFAALLAAEQSGPSPGAAPSWPAQPVPMPQASELADEVTRRVLERLSDTVVRETVADIVSKVAERLISEEIERIKKTIT